MERVSNGTPKIISGFGTTDQNNMRIQENERLETVVSEGDQGNSPEIKQLKSQTATNSACNTRIKKLDISELSRIASEAGYDLGSYG